MKLDVFLVLLLCYKLPEISSRSLSQGFSPLLVDIVVGAVLCNVGCSVASLASTH